MLPGTSNSLLCASHRSCFDRSGEGDSASNYFPSSPQIRTLPSRGGAEKIFAARDSAKLIAEFHKRWQAAKAARKD
jgi:hypothetical protein